MESKIHRVIWTQIRGWGVGTFPIFNKATKKENTLSFLIENFGRNGILVVGGGSTGGAQFVRKT